jgi:hypothetical protein
LRFSYFRQFSKIKPLAHSLWVGLLYPSSPDSRQVLLKVCATAEVLEAAAEAMRLKIRCRTAGADANSSMTTPPASSADELHPSRSTLNSAAAHRRAWAYFERAKREQYLGTPDPGSLFRSAERQVILSKT